MKFILTTFLPILILLLPSLFQITWTISRVKRRSELPIGITYVLTIGLLLFAVAMAIKLSDLGENYGVKGEEMQCNNWILAYLVGGSLVGTIIATGIAVFGLFAYYNQKTNE
jgi:hypothetical protein